METSTGILGFAIEAERLAGDVGDADQLFFAELGVVARLFIERGVIAQQVEGVGDGLERVVDLVRDDARNAAHGGEALGLAQSVFGFAAWR